MTTSARSSGIDSPSFRWPISSEMAELKEFYNRRVKQNFFYAGREDCYKNIEPFIFAEKLMHSKIDDAGGIRDYKFFCFDGVVKMVYVATGRQSGTGVCFDYFDADYHHLDLVQSHPMAAHTPEKPQGFELMKALAQKLSQGLPHVRVDFFDVNGRIYFGEMTFYDYAGYMNAVPQNWELEWGRLIKISV